MFPPVILTNYSVSNYGRNFSDVDQSYCRALREDSNGFGPIIDSQDYVDKDLPVRSQQQRRFRQDLQGSEHANNPILYLHLSDGGILDNSGLTALDQFLNLSDEASLMRSWQKRGLGNKREVIIVSVDARRRSRTTLSDRAHSLGMFEMVGLLAERPVDRAQDDMIERVRATFRERGSNLYHLRVNFHSEPLPNDYVKWEYNRIPTSFSISGPAIEMIDSHLLQILCSNTDFSRLVQDFSLVHDRGDRQVVLPVAEDGRTCERLFPGRFDAH